MIKKVRGGYQVVSHAGKPLSKILSKPAAVKRLQQVEYYKHKGKA